MWTSKPVIRSDEDGVEKVISAVKKSPFSPVLALGDSERLPTGRALAMGVTGMAIRNVASSMATLVRFFIFTLGASAIETWGCQYKSCWLRVGFRYLWA